MAHEQIRVAVAPVVRPVFRQLTILYWSNGYADRLAEFNERLSREAAEKAQEYAAMPRASIHASAAQAI